MNPKVREVGGGPSVGLAEDFTAALRDLIGANFGGQPTAGQRFNQANPTGSTYNFLGSLVDILSPGGGGAGTGLRETIARSQARDVADLRARFGASGGMSFGTPAAFAESLYRAEAAPRAAVATSQLQLSALLPLLSLLGQLSGRGISQRTATVGPSSFTQAASGIGGILEGIGEIIPG